MIWKTTIYLLFIALPAWFITYETGTTTDEITPTKVLEASTLKTTELVKTDAAILGSVIAPEAIVEICASNSTHSIKGTVNEKGEFFMDGFLEGNYKITIIATKNSTVKTYQFDNVQTYIGEVTALGTITLTK